MNKTLLYPRKSSEDKNRQVNSIDDQVAELTTLAEKQGYTIIDTIREEKSAKKPGRPGFNAMIERIHKGEADGILCWKLDRLARNPIDGGQIIWLLQSGIIKFIQTIDKKYLPTDNLIPLYLELGVANQYIKDLCVNVSRGTRQKAERGWSPAPNLPLGYIHNPEYKEKKSLEEIIVDENYFTRIRDVWNLLLTGAYSITELKREGDKLGLRHRRSGNKLCIMSYHRMFTNPFYAGYYYWRDKNEELVEYKGKHQKMINYDEFIQAQKILGNYSNPTRLKSYFFTYRGLIRCGECTGFVTAEYIHQVICTECKNKYSVKTNPLCRHCGMDYNKMKNPITLIKRYYRCSKKKNRNCKQKSIEEKEIEKNIIKILNKVCIGKSFYIWATSILNEQKTNSIGNTQELNLQKEQKINEKRLSNLMNMRIDGELTKQEFTLKAENYRKEIEQAKFHLRALKSKQENLQPRVLKRLTMLYELRKKFHKIEDKGKKELISELGYNLTLKDKKLEIITPKWILSAKEFEDLHITKNSRVQPTKLVEKLGV